jgi:hypothetical protein
MTGRPAATLLHLGPGLSNGLANLHNAGRALAQPSPVPASSKPCRPDAWNVTKK